MTRLVAITNPFTISIVDSVDAILPTMTWSGDIVTVDNIRDHIWKTDTEFTLRYQKLSYDLNEIE